MDNLSNNCPYCLHKDVCGKRLATGGVRKCKHFIEILGVVFLPTKAQEQRALVERALDIRLLDWQVAYIWGNSSYLMPGRATGKTLAHVIRLCLSEGEPLHMYPKGKDWGLCDEDHGIPYHRIYRDYVRDTLYKLKMWGGLKLRTIYFHPEEAKEVKNYELGTD